jgi:hypothetical protein
MNPITNMFPSLPVRNSFVRTNFAYYNPNRRLQPHQLDVGLNSRRVTSGPVSGCRLSCSSSRASSQCVSQRQFPPIDRKLFGGPLRLLTGPVMGVDFVICQVRLLVSRTCFSLPRACFSMVSVRTSTQKTTAGRPECGRPRSFAR